MKTFKGKAIYQPSGKAGEYSKYACNFYVGCSNGCTYCYCKKGILAGAMGQDKPQLKKCFKDEAHALEVFEKELKANLPELQKHGLFFSFTTDPMLEETIELTTHAIRICHFYNVGVKVLTKRAGFFEIIEQKLGGVNWDLDLIAFGFTITGHDELEPNASTNAERIETMRKLHEAGFKTWASIEPVIDFVSSARMIEATESFCDLYKIGLMSGKKYESYDCRRFVEHFGFMANHAGYKVYFKDSLLKAAGYDRDIFSGNCVDRDYNMFES
jgi:DNA repair photolyase